MTNYYVRKSGNDGTGNGLTPATAWLTIGKALTASAAFTSGDMLYIGAGRYDEHVTLSLATNPTSTAYIIGDVTGEFTGDPGEVAWTAYTSGLDAAPTTKCLTTVAYDYIHVQNICFYGGTTAAIDGTTSNTPTNWTFTNCAFIAAGAAAGHKIIATGAADTAMNWTIDRCKMLGVGGRSGGFTITAVTGAGADFDINFVIKNSLILVLSSNGGSLISVVASGTGAGHPGGVKVYNCTIVGSGGSGFSTTATYISTTVPGVTVNDCYIDAGGFTAFAAGTAGQIVEDYNFVVAGTYTAAGNSHKEDAFAAISQGQESIWGGRPRPFGAPVEVGGGYSRLLGRTLADPLTLTVDGQNRPRPAGGRITKAWGWSEYHDNATKETSVTDAGSVAIKLTGPGDQDIYIPVAAAATVITIKVRYDTNHGTGSKPQAILLANGEIGVATQTETAAAAVDTWETLTFDSFTPTAAGVVTIRLVSRSAAANGVAYFDTVTVA